MKSIIVLLSNCSECIFLDADNFALQSLEDIASRFDGLEAVFWPDMWDTSNAQLWRGVSVKELKSQESGQLFLRKSSPEARKALLLASLFAVRIDIFLEAIYGMQDGSLMCGYGDKDVFHLAFRLLNVPFEFASRLPSVILHRGNFIGLLQVDNSSSPIFLHNTWGKSTAGFSQLMKAKLERCDFIREDMAANISCSSSRSAGSVNIPINDMRCRRLSIPKKKTILKVLGN